MLKIASPVDVEVGARIRTRRKLIGLTQIKLAEAVGVTFQQIQKYEKGVNRVGSSRLVRIAEVLGTSPAALFGQDKDGSVQTESREANLLRDVTASPEGLALNKAFVKIQDPGVRKTLISLVKTLSQADDDGIDL